MLPSLILRIGFRGALRAYGACRVFRSSPRCTLAHLRAHQHAHNRRYPRGSARDLRQPAAQSGGEARMGRCAGDESDDGVGVRIQRAVLSRAYSTGSSAYRAGGAAARSRAVARGRAGAHARGGDRGMYAPRVAPSGVCARSNRMHGCVRFTTFIQRLGLIARSARSGGTGRRLSGRAVHCAPTARAGLAGNAALGDPHERAGDAERAHAGKRSSPHAPFITMAIRKRAL